METIPVLLDTDIGTDIDDAVALAYLLRQPRCELLGITTVTGEADKRAMLADAVCRAAGRDDVPMHVGAQMPLINPARQPQAAQAEALTAQWPHREFGPEPTAVDFLRNTIRARPGEITLLAIGPLTNVALLFALDPEIPKLLKQLVMMGGWFFARPAPEWNILNDPHAAQMVFAAPVPTFTAIGIDVTGQCTLAAEECRRRFTEIGGPLAPVAAMAEVWFRHVNQITFHDPLAAALIFEPSLCRTEAQRVTVELVSPYIQGQTLIMREGEGDEKPHRLAAEVDREAFFAHYFSVVAGRKERRDTLSL
ncbi:MAG: nucleoside hydrolase [Armatimonadota bacterium]|nr:nucleoside hydrolase [Armatimonadota bacterium]